MFVKEEASGLREIGLVTGQSSPVDLSLFELGILIDTINKEAPTYSLLQRQCYWYVAAIRYVVLILYGDKLATKKANTLVPSEYLPNLTGKWKNIPVPDPKDDVIRRVVVRFVERHEQEFFKVGFLLILFYLLLTCLNYLKVQRARQEEILRDEEMAALRQENLLLRNRLEVEAGVTKSARVAN
jgi:hypothetical protein